MANRRHVVRLKRGMDAWTQWRASHPAIEPDLSGTDLQGFEGCDFDLQDANLAKAQLSKADLRRANLCRAKFQEGNLQAADLRGANLFRSDFSGANLRFADFSGADLRGANLSQAIIDQADFSGTDLRTAYLSQTQAFATNFTEATLTGTCIEDWYINELTNLERVVCDCIYLKAGYQERRPVEGDFAPGDLARFFQGAAETVELVFHDRLNWPIFAHTFQRLATEKPDLQLVLRHLDARGNGITVAQLDVATNTDKADTVHLFMQVYEFFCARQTESQALASEGLNALLQTIQEFSHALQRDIPLVALELQQVLEGLSQSSSPTTPAEQTMVVAKALAEIDNTPALKQQVLDTLERDGGEILRKMVKSPLIEILLAALSSWQKSNNSDANHS